MRQGMRAGLFLSLALQCHLSLAGEVDYIAVRGKTIKVGDSIEHVYQVVKPTDQIAQDTTKGQGTDLLVTKYYKVDTTAFSITLVRVENPKPIRVTVTKIVRDDPKTALLDSQPICTSKFALSRFLNNYTGSIDEKYPIGLTLSFAGDALDGVYYYTRQLKDIRIAGTMRNGRDVELNEFDSNGKVVAVFKGSFQRWDPRGGFSGNLACEVITGYWRKVGSSEILPFYVRLENSTGGTLTNRYGVAGATDDSLVEKNAQTFWRGVQKGDRKTVARLIHYPINVRLDDKYQSIKDESELLKYYDKIFSKRYKDAIAKAIPHNMFVKYSGIMLGGGEVWFGADGKVITLHNF